jgi:hypothetical protein
MTMGERVWTKLPAPAAEGLTCVICGQNLRGRGLKWIPVGLSHTGSQVLACAGNCAQQAMATPQLLAIPIDALTAGGAAFLAVLERSGNDVHQADPDDLVTETVQAAIPLVVAAELRRIAAELRARAAELDPTGGESR